MDCLAEAFYLPFASDAPAAAISDRASLADQSPPSVDPFSYHDGNDLDAWLQSSSLPAVPPVSPEPPALANDCSSVGDVAPVARPVQFVNDRTGFDHSYGFAVDNGVSAEPRSKHNPSAH